MMTNTIERFSNRVSNYVKYRPTYPREVLDHFVSAMGLTPASVVADIGAGTGISSKLFVDNGNPVYGVEPNANMRAAAVDFLGGRDNFTAVDGTSAATTLANESVDIVIAAQAFHWFDPETARREFERILKQSGWVALMWNERRMTGTPFLVDYEEFLNKFGRDYKVVRHDNITHDELTSFFQKPYETATFSNSQIFDLEGLLGRAASASYMPGEDDAAFPLMAEELKLTFAKHEQNGRITVFYDTNIYYAQY